MKIHFNDVKIIETSYDTVPTFAFQSYGMQEPQTWISENL